MPLSSSLSFLPYHLSLSAPCVPLSAIFYSESQSHSPKYQISQISYLYSFKKPSMLLLLLLFLLHSSSNAAAAAATNVTLTLQVHVPNSPTTSTIPAFPEQSADSSSSSSCPLSLPLRCPSASLRPSCLSSSHRLRCCPALATLLFSAYPLRHLSSPSLSAKQGSYDLPEVPEDTETCSEEVGKALRDAGVDVSYRNASCDLVFCYCGIRLHRMSCEMDDRVFHERAGSLARDCSAPGMAGCSKCLTSLSMLRSSSNSSTASRSSNEGGRTTKAHDQDCRLLGLAWLLARNQSAYARIVTAVFRAMMSSPEGSFPKSCTIGSNGLPLAVDSSEVSGDSTPPYASRWPTLSFLLLVCYLHILSLPRLS